MSNTTDPELEELVSKMASGSKLNTKNTVNLDNIDFDKLDEKTRKVYSDFKHGDVDIYKIIGASPDDSQDKIKKKYIEKMTKYHPDKHSIILNKLPPDRVDKEKRRLMATYNLIKNASKILLDPEKRKFYDLQKKANRSKNFETQKDDFNSFIKQQEAGKTDEGKKMAKLDFEKKQLELDKKHKVNRNEATAIALKDARRKMDDLAMEREQQAIEIAPKQIFDKSNFTQQDFNKHFLKNKKKEEKKNKQSKDRSVVLWDGVSASNDMGTIGASFVSVDHDYEDLYVDENFESTGLASANVNNSESSEEASSVMSEEIDDSYLEKNQRGTLTDEFSKFMNKRNTETKMYDAREMGKDWKSLDDNPFNISTQVKMDNAFSSMTNNKFKYDKNVDKDMVEVYKQILYEDDE